MPNGRLRGIGYVARGALSIAATSFGEQLCQTLEALELVRIKNIRRPTKPHNGFFHRPIPRNSRQTFPTQGPRVYPLSVIINSSLITAVATAFLALVSAYIVTKYQISGQERQTIAARHYEAFSQLYSLSVVSDLASGEEFLDAEQASRLLRYASLADAETLRSLAKLKRSSDMNCQESPDECVDSFTAQLALHRQAMGLTSASQSDLNSLLRAPILALSKVSRGRNDSKALIMSPKPMEIEGREIPALNAPWPQPFIENFPSKKFVIVLQLTAIEESKGPTDESPLSYVCIALAGLSHQPARGINPRIANIGSSATSRVPLDNLDANGKRRCMLDAADRSVDGLMKTPIEELARGLSVQLKR